MLNKSRKNVFPFLGDKIVFKTEYHISFRVYFSLIKLRKFFPYWLAESLKFLLINEC